MKNFKKHFTSIMALTLITFNFNVVNAGGRLSKPKNGSFGRIPHSPSWGEYVLPLSDGCLASVSDPRSLIENYSLHGKHGVTLPPEIQRIINLIAADLDVTLKRAQEEYSGGHISYKMSIIRDDYYVDNLQALQHFFNEIQTGNLFLLDEGSADPTSKRKSILLDTRFTYAAFMSRIYQVMNSASINYQQKMVALQMLLEKLKSQKDPIYIFSSDSTETILKLNPAKIIEIRTVLVAEGSSMQNAVLQPGTLAILLKFSENNPKAGEIINPLSLLYFVR